MTTFNTVVAPAAAGIEASLGRNPIRTTRMRRIPLDRPTRYSPRSLVMLRASTEPDESSSIRTAPGIGCRLVLSVTVPRSCCARRATPETLSSRPAIIPTETPIRQL
jgi:hypothetical protein